MITGASSGIGYDLSKKFIKQGYQLVLVARDGQKLEKIASEFKKNHAAEIICIKKDLSQPHAGKEIFETLKNKNIFVEVLVNNAGFGLHGSYAETDLNKELDMVNLHIGSFLYLTKVFLKDMISKKTGKILNVGSVYSYSSVPNQSVYAATKAFMLSFSESLRHELKGSGIHVTLLCPGITQTEFRKRMGVSDKKSHHGMSSKQVADIAYQALMKKKFLAVPGGVNKFYVFLAKTLPKPFMTNLIDFLNHFRGINQ